MGSGSSITSSRKRNSKVYVDYDFTDEKDLKETPRTLSSSAKALVSVLRYQRPEMVTPVVSRQTQMACEQSWYTIMAVVGVGVFSTHFFDVLGTQDPEAYALFVPAKKADFTPPSKFENRAGLLYGVVSYLLNLHDMAFKTKKKIRALGRRHFISGIHRSHVKSFNDAFLMAVESYPGAKGNPEASRSWITVLDFTLQEMYIEDIKLLKH
jgi:hypothetical protein